MGPRPRRAALLAAAITVLAAAAAAPSQAATTWLCKPGLTRNPCQVSPATTTISPTGKVIGRQALARPTKPRIDCFYVYPTTSDEKMPQADLRVTPELRSIARFQTARYSDQCRVFAPVYRQITIQGLLQPATVTPAMRAQALVDVRAAFADYLAHDNHGRGFVFIAHSQGSFVLRQLIAKDVDPKASVRRRLVSALLLGGNVTVRKGSDAGGDFQSIRACRMRTQTGCVVAFSTYGATPPADSRFGRATEPGREVLCTNPAALGGGPARIEPVFPTVAFAPGTVIGGLTNQVGFPIAQASTPWIAAPGAYTARCSKANGASVLRITPRGGAPTLKALPDATWGLHLTDANIALGDLVRLVRVQTAAYFERHAS